MIEKELNKKAILTLYQHFLKNEGPSPLTKNHQ